MIDLEPKYLPYAIPQDGVTKETVMRWAPSVYFSREVLPKLRELDDPGTWSFAYRWANDVDRVGLTWPHLALWLGMATVMD